MAAAVVSRYTYEVEGIALALERSGDRDRTSPVGPVVPGALILHVQDGTIPNNSARQVFEDLWAAGRAASETADAQAAAEAAHAEELLKKKLG